MHLQTVIYATISVLFHTHFTTHVPHHQPPDSICLDGSNSIYLWISDFRPHQIYSRAVMLHTRQVVHPLLMLSGQVELNPGPYTPKFPCQICSKAVKWGQRALACDNCDQWCHTECMTMTSEEYHHLADTSVIWLCKICHAPNLSNLYGSITVTDNSFSSLSTDLHTTSVIDSSCHSTTSLGSPMASSSPNRSTKHNDPEKSLKSLRAIVINFQSIKNKVHETQVLIDNADPDIILGTEMWLNGNISSAEVLPTNFQVFRNDRSDSYGGVLIAVREDLICSPVLTSQNTELIGVKLQLNRAKSIIISSFCRPPNMTEDTYSSAALEELIKLKHDNQQSDFCIGGDFNLPGMNWSCLTVTSNQYSYAMTDTYLDILRNCNVEQIVDFPTRGNKTLDIFLTSNPGLIDRCKPIPGVGDHDAVLIDTLIKPRHTKPTRKTIHLWDKANITEFKTEVKAYINKFTATPFSTINDMWTSFRDNILKLLDKHVPHKQTRSRHTNPWMDTTTWRLTRQKN